MKKPILFTTLGYPGSGKTFFSRRFAKDLRLFHLNSDRLRLEIFPNPNYTTPEHATVFRTMDFLTDELLQRGVSVIYDANSTKRIYRKRLQDIAKKRKADYVLLWFKTPTEVALKRIEKRSNLKSELMKRYHRTIDDEVLFGIKAEEEIPNKERHIVLGVGSYKKQKELVMNFLRTQG
ncbi:MAG: ATP-binding protein [Candidatus Moranbacteria bacterium]|nr:ATP-binding protein [Candidatus Moranbacteria bacterium]